MVVFKTASCSTILVILQDLSDLGEYGYGVKTIALGLEALKVNQRWRLLQSSSTKLQTSYTVNSALPRKAGISSVGLMVRDQFMRSDGVAGQGMIGLRRPALSDGRLTVTQERHSIIMLLSQTNNAQMVVLVEEDN